ncbi:uncharacterized protein MJAP1_002581 [Malassezia japonica]|uniref:Uncharacterized protein n=1 Tax=Malassezia japonica TaxID=223818 RepID=A0AAF0JG54_9BASI|nr:uncharacterized protein MJAP1_002581 [Malassezia japonica]WFD39601.1 hypothetical protein MJAP1_002581 [Malassezia japonica]
MGDPEAERGRLERIRAAKRALRKFQQRREQEQSKRASRTLRASVVLQGADVPTLLTQSYTATNNPSSSARESAHRATESSRRRHSRTQSILSEASDKRSSRQRFSMSGPASNSARRSVHVRNPSVALPAQLPPPTGRRPMSVVFSHQPRASIAGVPVEQNTTPQTTPRLNSSPRLGDAHRRSRHSRQFSVSTRRESFEIMSGRALPSAIDTMLHSTQHQRQSRAGRASVRFSALEAASVLFGNPQKPLPPVPQEWRAGLWANDDEDGEDRVSALDKLEGRSGGQRADTERAPRASTPSWLGEPLQGAPPPPPRKESPPADLDTLVEEDEEESQASLRRKERRDATPTKPDTSAEKEADTSRSLRPLRLSTMNASGTPLLGGRSMSATKAQRRVSNIMYKPPTDADERPLRHQAPSSRSAQSSNTSWPMTDAAGSVLFSPKSIASDSPGATSVDSADHTPRRKPPPADRQREVMALQREVEEVRQVMGAQVAQVAQARDAAEARAAALDAEMRTLRERVEEIEGERDMHKEDVDGWRTRCSDLEQTIQSQQLRFKQEQTWRHAATKRMQALSNRLKSHESSFDSNSSGSQLVSLSSMSSMSPLSFDRTLDPIADLPELPQMPSDDELGGWSMQIARQLSKHAPDMTHDGPSPETVRVLSDMRQQIITLYSELKLEQSNHELTRTQLRELKMAQAVDADVFLGQNEAATFTPADAQHGYAGETPALSTPRSRSASARRKRQAFLPDGPAPAFLEELSKTDAPDTSGSQTRSEDTSGDRPTENRLHERPPTDAETTADVLFADDLKRHSLVGLGLSSPPKDQTSFETVARTEPAWPETSQDTSWLEEAWPSAPDTSASDVSAGIESIGALEQAFSEARLGPKGDDASSDVPYMAEASEPESQAPTSSTDAPGTPHEAAPGAESLAPATPLAGPAPSDATEATPKAADAPSFAPRSSTTPPSPDLEAGDESAWVSDEEPDTPGYIRPEFIPEWSFDQAMFEAAQDVRVYELSGRKPRTKQSRRGAARVNPAPVEDFFGILSADGELEPALPLPNYALEMPPVDVSKLSAPPSPASRTATVRKSAASLGLGRPSVVGRSAYVDDAVRAPAPASITVPMLDSFPTYEAPNTSNEESSTSQFLTQMFSSLKSPWHPSNRPMDDCETHDTSEPELYPAMSSPKQETPPSTSPVWPTTPTFGTADRLAPSIPAPSTPVPRSPDARAPSPSSIGKRYIKANAQTRIPVPTPVWRLNFTPTTATPMARPPFTI